MAFHALKWLALICCSTPLGAMLAGELSWQWQGWGMCLPCVYPGLLC